MKVFILAIICSVLSYPLFGQDYTGYILNRNTKLPVEYVNIGIVGKNIGTVCDNIGKYFITIDNQFDNDTLLISCIGYNPFSVKVSDYKKLEAKNIYLDEKLFEIKEVVVRPKVYKQEILGVTAKSKSFRAGFKENKLGYECGILMKVKKSAILENVNMNFAECTYDTIFYRLNIYKVIGKMKFENILQKAIYIKLSKDQVNGKVVIDLNPYNIIAHGDLLITLEHVKNLGNGYLYFCAGMSGRTYYRKTSQGAWETVPVGVSISVEAKVEK